MLFRSFQTPADGITIAEEEEKSYEWLQERDKPEDLIMIGVMYGGPEIVVE